jgi:hypothetical protein
MSPVSAADISLKEVTAHQAGERALFWEAKAEGLKGKPDSWKEHRLCALRASFYQTRWKFLLLKERCSECGSVKLLSRGEEDLSLANTCLDLVEKLLNRALTRFKDLAAEESGSVPAGKETVSQIEISLQRASAENRIAESWLNQAMHHREITQPSGGRPGGRLSK